MGQMATKLGGQPGAKGQINKRLMSRPAGGTPTGAAPSQMAMQGQAAPGMAPGVGKPPAPDQQRTAEQMAAAGRPMPPVSQAFQGGRPMGPGPGMPGPGMPGGKPPTGQAAQMAPSPSPGGKPATGGGTARPPARNTLAGLGPGMMGG